MSLNAINWMAKQTTGDDKMKSALFWLAFHLNDETGECFPSISTLQAEMEVKSDNTVRGALRRLREAGFISWERETKDGLTVKTNYHLHMNGSMAEGTSVSNGTSTIAVPQPLREGTSTVEGGTSTIAGGVLQPVRTNKEIEQGINKEENKESSMRTSGNSAIAAVASAQAQTLPTSFPQSSNSQNHSETKTAGKDSLPNASERSVAAHRDRPDTSDEQTCQNNDGRSQNASTSVSLAYPENEPPPMSDEDLENLFADAQLAGAKPNTVKAEAPKHRTTTPRKKPATRCPFDADASIPDEYKAIAEKVGIRNPQQVFSAFVNHAIAHDRSLVVWPAGFRTWCSNELRYHPNQTPKPKPLHQRTAADYDW